MGRPRKNPEQNLPIRVYLKSNAFYYLHKEGQRWEHLGKDLAEATKIAASYNANKPISGSMGYWLDQWLLMLAKKVERDDLADRTLDDYTKACVPLKAYFGHMLPTRITTPQVTDYIDIGKDSNRSVRANREKAALSSCMSWMVSRGKAGLVSNPCKGAPRNTETKRDRYISDAEYSAVLGIASAPVRAWMELVYRTLQRPSDILKWTQANLVKNGDLTLISFKQGKTGAAVRIAMTPTLQKTFDEVAAARSVSSTFLICQENGEKYKFTGIDGMFRRHVAAAGLKDFGIYDLKGKGATDMYNSGTPLADICGLCAHASERTTEVYIKERNPKIQQSNDREIPSNTDLALAAKTTLKPAKRIRKNSGADASKAL